jgi:DNA-binding response OmpR family regulator
MQKAQKIKAHILLVEDDERARLALGYRLHYDGYHVVQAADGKTAIDLLEQQEFQVVLTDIVLGDIDGIEVLHSARLQSYRPAVILLTGHGTLDTAIAALREGAYDYLQKPCADEDLLKCIESAVQHYNVEYHLTQAATLLTSIYGRPEAPPPPADTSSSYHPRRLPDIPNVVRNRSSFITIGKLCIGMSRDDVTFAGQPVPLTPIEYTLLRFLAEQQGNVCTFTEIARHTHRFELDNDEAQKLLKTHIRNLRKKLEPAYLINDRGTGYKLINPAEHA